MNQQGQLPFGTGRSPSQGDPGKPAPARERSRKVIQDVLVDEGLWAVMRADQHESLESLTEDVAANLKQQSKGTRIRYARSITRWFFPNRDINSPAVLVWSGYHDKSLLTELLRVLYLKAEPIVGRCVEEFLYPIQENALIPGTYFDSYLLTSLSDIPPKTQGRLKMNLRKLGFLAKSAPGKDLLRPLNPSGTALFLLFTFYFARDEVRTAEMPTVLKDPFWKYLGFKSEDSVRRVFREAANSGLLAKYVVADQLELLTTALTFQQCIERKVRL